MRMLHLMCEPPFCPWCLLYRAILILWLSSLAGEHWRPLWKIFSPPSRIGPISSILATAFCPTRLLIMLKCCSTSFARNVHDGISWQRLLLGSGWSYHFHHLPDRSEEHTSELQSLMRISYAVFCLKKKKKQNKNIHKSYKINQTKQ